MSERDVRRFLQDLEGEEKSPEDFEAEMEAWNDAVTIADYVGMFRNGSILKTNIYGSPYESSLEALRDCEYSDRLADLHRQLVNDGLQMVEFAKPKLDELFPEPVDRAKITQEGMFSGSNANGLRETYFRHFFDMMYTWGLRDLMSIGTQGYLDQVPDRLSLFAFCAPTGTKSFVSQDGYVALGYDLVPDFERPLSQRGGESGFLRTEFGHHAAYFKDLTSQITFLVENLDNFAFDTSDLLGYRPKDMTEAGIALAWSGWQSQS